MKTLQSFCRTFKDGRKVTNILAGSSVVFLLYLAIFPTRQGLCHTHILLTYAIVAITTIGVCVNAKKNTLFYLSSLDFALGIWFLYFLVRMFWGSQYPCSSVFLRITQMLLLYVAMRILFSSSSITERPIVFSIIAFSVCEIGIGIGQFVQMLASNNVRFPVGSFQNSGPYAATMAMGLTMTLYRQKIKSSTILYIPITIFTLILTMAMSRAAILSSAICSGIIFWNLWKRWFWWVVMASVFAGTFLYHIKEGSAEGRLIIYYISFLNILHSPVFGGGIGSFFYQYAEEMARFSRENPEFNFHSVGVPDYAFNDLLQIWVEQGCFGITFAITTIILTFISLKGRGDTLNIGMLSLLIFSFFSYPFELLPYQIVTVIILAYAGTKVSPEISHIHNDMPSSRYYKHITVLALIIPATLFVNARIIPHVKAEARYQKMTGITDYRFTNEYYKLLTFLRENPQFLFDFGKLLRKQGKYIESNNILQLGTLVSADPVFRVLQGNNYRDMKCYKKAETAFKQAFHILPNRIYPLYLLMYLYRQMGEQDKMLHMAKTVLDFNVKIETTETDEMKKSAQKVIEEKNNLTF